MRIKNKIMAHMRSGLFRLRYERENEDFNDIYIPEVWHFKVLQNNVTSQFYFIPKHIQPRKRYYKVSGNNPNIAQDFQTDALLVSRRITPPTKNPRFPGLLP